MTHGIIEVFRLASGNTEKYSYITLNFLQRNCESLPVIVNFVNCYQYSHV